MTPSKFPKTWAALRACVVGSISILFFACPAITKASGALDLQFLPASPNGTIWRVDEISQTPRSIEGATAVARGVYHFGDASGNYFHENGEDLRVFTNATAITRPILTFPGTAKEKIENEIVIPLNFSTGGRYDVEYKIDYSQLTFGFGVNIVGLSRVVFNAKSEVRILKDGVPIHELTLSNDTENGASDAELLTEAAVGVFMAFAGPWLDSNGSTQVAKGLYDAASDLGDASELIDILLSGKIDHASHDKIFHVSTSIEVMEDSVYSLSIKTNNAVTAEQLGLAGFEFLSIDTDIILKDVVIVTATEPIISLEISDGDYSDKIEVEWNTNYDASQFYILRSTTPNISNSSIVAFVNGSSYDDYAVNRGLTYYYWIRDSTQTSVVSAVGNGSTSPQEIVTGINVTIDPGKVAHDQISYATLTATVRDSSLNPLAGRIVKFNMPATTPGGWWDPVGNKTLYDPVSVSTNSQGRAVAHHMPTELGDVDLVVSSGSATEQVSYESIPDPGITVVLNVSLNRRSETSQTYRVEGNFTYSSGAGIADGTVRFTTSLGVFENGLSSIDLSRLGHGGKSTTLTVQESGTATITATYLPSGSTATQNVVIQLGDVPQMNSAFALSTPKGSVWNALDRGNRYLAILENDKGMAFYDTHTLLLDSYIDEADFSSSEDDWAGAGYIAFALDDNTVVAADNEDIGILYRTQSAFYSTRSSSYHPEDNIDVHPQGTRWAAVTDEDNGNINLEIYTMSGGRERILKSYPNAYIYGLAFSPDGSRLAATIRDYDYSPQRTGLLLWNASNWSLIDDIELNRGARPEGVAFSPDSSLLAVSSGDRSLLLLDKNGGAASLPYTQIAFTGDPVDIEFSPDGQYLAAHIDGGGVSIIQVATSLEISNLNGVAGDSRFYDSVAWSGDGRFVFALWSGTRTVSVFAPFDTQDPIISTSEDHDGKIVSEPTLTIAGTATDDVMIKPNGLRYRINDGGWSNITLSSSGAFTVDAVLQGGTNDIVIEATDVAGRSTTIEQSVAYPVPAVFQFTALNGEIEMDVAVEKIYPGDVFSAEAIPDSGYQFLQWGGLIPADLSQQNPVTLVATQSMDMVALFGLLHYGIITTAHNGSISLSPQLESYESGSSVVATASPDIGYSFSGWIVNGVESDVTGSQLTLIVEKGIVLEAVFEPYQYSVNFVVDERGDLVSGVLSQTVSHGARAAPPLIDAVPGWYFLGWSADTSQVVGDLTVTARFEKLNRSPVLDPIGNISVNTGTEIHFTATASDPDIPAQTLTYALAGAPSGASIDSLSGYFSWTPNQEQVAGIFTFTVQVSDGTLVDTEEININIDSGLVITKQPLSQSVQVGSIVEFFVTHSGEGAFNYQWRKNGNPIEGETSATLMIENVQNSDTGDYDVVVSNSVSNVTSELATLTVVPEVTGTLGVDGPSSYSPDGGTVTVILTLGYPGKTLSVLGAIIPLPSGWAYKAVGGINPPPFPPDSGTTGSAEFAYLNPPTNKASFEVTLEYAAGLSGDQQFGGTFLLKVSGNSNEVLVSTNTVTFTEVTPPSISRHPVGAVSLVGGKVTFSVEAAGTAPLAYEWFNGSNSLSGSTTSTLMIDPVALSDAGDYSVRVSNEAGTVASSPPANLTVLDMVASHTVEGGGYRSGGTVTISNRIVFAGNVSVIGWSVPLPDDQDGQSWSYAGGSGDDQASVPPEVGDTLLLDWAWFSVPASPIDFSYTLNVPEGLTGEQQLSAMVLPTFAGVQLQGLVQPEPLVMSEAPSYHSGDTDNDFKFSLSELLRVIELYNTREGTVRTGLYHVDDSSADGFAPGAGNPTSPPYHSADTSKDSKFSLSELLRVIELYNYREGTVRTGAYHIDPDSSDGFAPGSGTD